MKLHKIQRNWDHFPTRDIATEDSMRAAQRKALFELLRDVTEYAKKNPSCRIKNLRFDPLGEWGAIGVEMENIPLDNTKNES